MTVPILPSSPLMTSFHSPLSNCHPLHSSSCVSQEKLTFGPRNSYTVEGLKPNTEYSFSLAAISNKGIGAFTNELVQRTSQASMSQTRLMALISLRYGLSVMQLSRTSRSSEHFPRLPPCCSVLTIFASLHLSPLSTRPLSSILTVPFSCIQPLVFSHSLSIVTNGDGAQTNILALPFLHHLFNLSIQLVLMSFIWHL